MKKITCELCGSTDLRKENGLFVCQYCGCQYTLEEAKKMIITGTIDVSGSTVKIDNSERLQKLYILAHRARDNNDSENALKYYNELSIEDPNSWEAQFYKIYYSCLNIKIAQIGNACTRLSNSLDIVFDMIQRNIHDEKGKKEAYLEVYARCLDYHDLMMENILNTAESSSNSEYGRKFAKEHGTKLVFFDFKVGDILAGLGLKDEAGTMYKESMDMWDYFDRTFEESIVKKIRTVSPGFIYKVYPETNSGGCYIATAVYGSYDCPQVWTLRRFRDYALSNIWYGRAFIYTYYCISPTLVKWFGQNKWFKDFWKGILDKMIYILQQKGYVSTPYEDFNDE